jgi:hypothetical protein
VVRRTVGIKRLRWPPPDADVGRPRSPRALPAQQNVGGQPTDSNRPGLLRSQGGSAGLVYHYPATQRPGRDSAEIAATKRAAELQLPVFVITTAADPALRDVRRSYVASYDDDAATFVLTFSDEPLVIAPRPRRRRSTGLARYRRANETPATTPREPFSVDPNEVDRALGAHAATQNALADWLEGNGLTPFSPPGGGADFDLAWEREGRLYVAEVKSLNDRNETKQLRLGLGQVLHSRMTEMYTSMRTCSLLTGSSPDAESATAT